MFVTLPLSLEAESSCLSTRAIAPRHPSQAPHFPAKQLSATHSRGTTIPARLQRPTAFTKPALILAADITNFPSITLPGIAKWQTPSSQNGTRLFKNSRGSMSAGLNCSSLPNPSSAGISGDADSSAPFCDRTLIRPTCTIHNLQG